MSHLLFHRLFVFHHSRCDPALSVFASKCPGECYAWTAALCDLGDPGWGDPWFPQWALLLLSPSCGYGLVAVGVLPFLSLFAAIPWCDDTGLSPLAWICQWTGSQSFLFCGLVSVLFLCCFGGLFLPFFGLLLMMTASWTMYRSFTSSLLWPSISRRPRVLIWKLMLLQCHWAYWTTWRKPWRRWTEKNGCISCSWSVQTLPKTGVPLSRMLFTIWRPSFEVLSRSLAIASANVDGIKYFLLLLRPCCLARSSCRDRWALGAARNWVPALWILLVPPDPVRTELIGAATETATINRNRAPSGPVKVSVPTQPQERPQGGVSLTSGVAALLAWFPASWASKIAPCFLSQGGAPQDPQEVTIPCPTREAPGMQRAQRAQRDRVLQAVRFVDKKAPGIDLGIDEDYQASGCFSEVIRGYQMGVIEPTTMHGF